MEILGSPSIFAVMLNCSPPRGSGYSKVWKTLAEIKFRIVLKSVSKIKSQEKVTDLFSAIISTTNFPLAVLSSLQSNVCEGSTVEGETTVTPSILTIILTPSLYLRKHGIYAAFVLIFLILIHLLLASLCVDEPLHHQLLPAEFCAIRHE